MKSWSFILLFLIGFSIIGGCITRETPQPVTTPPPTTEAPIPAEEIPEISPQLTEVPPEELIEEPDFEVNETVDLGSIL